MVVMKRLTLGSNSIAACIQYEGFVGYDNVCVCVSPPHFTRG